MDTSELAPILDELLALPTLRDLAGYNGSYAAQAAAKRATSELTGRFVEAAVVATREKYGDGVLLRYGADLIIPMQTASECALLKGVAAHYVMRRAGAAERLASQRAALTQLSAAVFAASPGVLDVALRPAWERAADDRERLRVVVDQIAQLTDSAALRWHARLVNPDDHVVAGR
jgi:dGTPase